MPNLKKQALVAKLVDKFQENANIALVNFEKTSHIAMEGLRRELRAVGASMTVVKTSLLEKAIEQSKSVAALKEKAFPITHATALVDLRGDWSAGLKAVYAFFKKDPSLFFRIGFLDGVVYDRNSLEKLAQLPGKSELVGIVIRSMKNPAARLNTAMTCPTTYLINVLKARSSRS
jgi:large subunit ribosomal protein L10